MRFHILFLKWDTMGPKQSLHLFKGVLENKTSCNFNGRTILSSSAHHATSILSSCQCTRGQSLITDPIVQPKIWKWKSPSRSILLHCGWFKSGMFAVPDELNKYTLQKWDGGGKGNTELKVDSGEHVHLKVSIRFLWDTIMLFMDYFGLILTICFEHWYTTSDYVSTCIVK